MPTRSKRETAADAEPQRNPPIIRKITTHETSYIGYSIFKARLGTPQQRGFPKPNQPKPYHPTSTWKALDERDLSESTLLGTDSHSCGRRYRASTIGPGCVCNLCVDYGIIQLEYSWTHHTPPADSAKGRKPAVPGRVRLYM